MNIAPDLLDKACLIDGDEYDTGLRVQGLEVWATPPCRYRHGTSFKLKYPEPFEVVARRGDTDFLGKPRYEIGYWLPNQKFRATHGSFKSLEEAVSYIDPFTGGQYKSAHCLNVFYTRSGVVDGSFCSKEEGLPVAVLVGGDVWSAFEITVAPGDAQRILDFQETVQQEWRKRSQEWIEAENRRTEEIARAVALDSISPHVIHQLHGPTECRECGATYDKPGHVEPGGMCCDLCQ